MQFMNVALWCWLLVALGFLVYLFAQKLIDVSPPPPPSPPWGIALKMHFALFRDDN